MSNSASIVHIKKNKSFVSSQDGLVIFYDLYMPLEPYNHTKLIQIAHGMVEHKARYEWVGKALAKEGFIVAINDHRGHGKSTDEAHPYGEMKGNKLESTKKQNTQTQDSVNKNSGFKRAIMDMHQFSEILKSQFQPQTFILLGHSMGSLLSRGYLELYAKDIDLLILSGSPAYNPMIPFGIVLAQILRFFHLETFGKNIINNLSFGGFNAPFKHDKSEDKAFAWLCSDRAVVDAYKADSACQFVFSLQSFIGLFGGMNWVNHIPKATLESPAIFIISGEKDSCGDFGKGVKHIAQNYQNNGFSVKIKLYPNARHEILNETNKKQVISDIVSFINDKSKH